MCGEQTIIIHYSEIGLKGRNQPQFRRQLRDNVRRKLQSAGLDWPARETKGYVSVPVPAEAPAGAVGLALEKLRQVFGIAWLASSSRFPHGRFKPETHAQDMAALQARVLELAHAQYAPGKTFCVRVKREDKLLPFTSIDLARQLGEAILNHTKWDRVSVTAPDVTFQVDLRHDAAFLFSEKSKGPGGLPVGCAGRVLTLLSGGIDSPVAAWLMAKRGCRVDYIHFTASSMQPEEARQYKVWRLARHLGQYTFHSRLVLVPYTYFDLALMNAGQEIEFELILFRRFMARVAEQLARQWGAPALVSGDNLSQVASQTLSNLVSASQAVTMPILRPLISFDKNDIVQLAQRIGTFELSIEPYKDCCAIISRHPRTRSNPEILAELERRLFPDYQKLIDQTLGGAITLEAGGEG
jgi:thiamine biosynthesis protein ThiI